MTRLERQRRPSPGRSARGFTFVEIMIAMALGLFLIGGLLTLVQAMRRTSTNQSGLSQLQDNERMAMQLVTDVVQSTGYFTNPVLNTAAGQFPAGHFRARGFHLRRAGSRRQRRRTRHHHFALPDCGDECRRQRHQLHRESRAPCRRAS